MVIVGDDGVLSTLTAYLNVLQPLGNDELLFVDAFFYENNLVVVHKCATNLYGVVDIPKLRCAVAGYEECVGVVILACSQAVLR